MSADKKFHELEVRARKVYSGLFEELLAASQVYVGGIRGPGGEYVLGESSFLCRIFPNLVFIDDWRVGSQFGREVINTAEFAARVKSSDVLINNCQSIAGYNHFERQAASLCLNSYSTLEVLAAAFSSGIRINTPALSVVYGPAFHRHTLDNLDLYRNMMGLFTDRLSNLTLANIIQYRLSGNPFYLQSIAIGHHYGIIQHDSYMLNKQFINLGDNEVFVDAGALGGETTEYFIRSVRGNFKRIFLFEPSTESMLRTRKCVEALDREFIGKNINKKCEFIEKGLYSFNGELVFANSLYDESVTLDHGVMPQSAHIIETGLSSSFVASGQEYNVTKIPVTTLDDVVSGDNVTFIKFEIEGSEVDALKGAINTIKRCRPRMGLSVYHRPQDLELIIQFVQELKLNYRMALRAHNPLTPDAIVLYCY